MIEIFCRDHHHSEGRADDRADDGADNCADAPTIPCTHCATLIAYASARLERCTFKDAKPACAKCPIHCYRQTERDVVRSIMRYSGPRMLTNHPILAILHLADELLSAFRIRKWRRRRSERSA
ncbi:MAG: hypothetical protein A2X94_08585 [Bdellovibrionales bacterium GWB1_55_8]|nr:MAG: hypothetical protein A2X94_08585 [Bdellovibrionales bacterium GWB1_55_8]